VPLGPRSFGKQRRRSRTIPSAWLDIEAPWLLSSAGLTQQVIVSVRGAVCGTVFGLACGRRRWPRPPMAARDPAIRQRPAARPALTCSRTTSRPPSPLPQAGGGRPAGRQQHGSASGEPDAGAHTRRVPKFADQPILVVPPAGDASSGRRSLPVIAFAPGRGRQRGETWEREQPAQGSMARPRRSGQASGRVVNDAPGGWPTWGAPRLWAMGC
jgi:hypothetical protein